MNSRLYFRSAVSIVLLCGLFRRFCELFQQLLYS
ncbi:hypothetical protein R3I93_016386 [Phoxinus phoxinus]|uniref:Uncharacterized protein n=1 Tax=Phoxinus phoxinus TaxID=58324 RepID=A0AAN9CNR1_9TELE